MSGFSPFVGEGIDRTPGGVQTLRRALIARRDAAMDVADFDLALMLSDTIAMLAYLLEVLDKGV